MTGTMEVPLFPYAHFQAFRGWYFQSADPLFVFRCLSAKIRQKGQSMKIEVLNEIRNGHKEYVTIEIPDDDYTVMLDIEYHQRVAKAPEDKKSEVKRCETVQEVFDIMSKEEYNDWHRENRHAAYVPTKEVNGEEINAFTFIPDNSDEEEREKSEDYEAWCQVIRNALKSEEAEMTIAIAIDGVTPEEYAKQYDLKRDTVYKRYQRARKKLKKYMLEHWNELPFENNRPII